MKRRIREDQIEWSIGDERFDVALLEAEHFVAERVGLEQHRLRVVDADGFFSAEVRVEIARELAGSAAEIDDAHARMFFDEREKIVEWLTAFLFESLVLIRIPTHRR